MKRPAFQFYGGDWLKDPGLRACSLAARGLWMDMIAIMSQVEEPYGHLVFVARKDGVEDGAKDILTPILPSVLARMVGASESDVCTSLAELESFGVFSRTPEGFIFSRRMVKDEKVRQSRASGGFQSSKNPNVPKKKSDSEDVQRMGGRISFEGSFGGSPSSSSSTSVYILADSELFEVYKTYPLRKAKGAALKAIQKAVVRVAKRNGSSVADALVWLKSRVELFAKLEQKKATDPKFIPLPATWFNQERYDDEELTQSQPSEQPASFRYRDPASLYSGPEYAADRRPA
ncbi:hypothetical protein [Silvibacterium sp.]|uniref:hypothetical protein n=1 Tax=Silvibacterium sp. TaxID=1964179 RepID=UPI0039E54D91